jgi:hypothetical protein
LDDDLKEMLFDLLMWLSGPEVPVGHRWTNGLCRFSIFLDDIVDEFLVQLAIKPVQTIDEMTVYRDEAIRFLEWLEFGDRLIVRDNGRDSVFARYNVSDVRASELRDFLWAEVEDFSLEDPNARDGAYD